jgi:uncharacterized membrane protein (DUF485 family)
MNDPDRDPPLASSPADAALWRQRFILMNLSRIAGTVVALLGLLIWHSDWLREGGAVEIGLPMAVAGVLASFLLPKYLARRWTPKR